MVIFVARANVVIENYSYVVLHLFRKVRRSLVHIRLEGPMKLHDPLRLCSFLSRIMNEVFGFSENTYVSLVHIQLDEPVKLYDALRMCSFLSKIINVLLG